MHLGPILVVALAALAAAAHAYGLQPGPQCVSQIYNLTYQGLQPGWYRYYWLNLTGTGAVHLVIRADVSSNVPVELAIYQWQNNAQWQRIWATQPSTRITGTYAVDLEAPGAYGLAVENPRSNAADASFTAILNATMCGGPAPGSWLGRFIKPRTTNMVLNGGNASMASMGIASYGVMEVGGRYFTYTLTTDAVRGVAHIPPDVSASNYREDGSYYGQAFSVQLNAFVVARLKDGAVQYYWIQNFVSFDEKYGGLRVWNNIWNFTTRISILDKSAVKGNGAVYFWRVGHGEFYYYGMPGTIPFGRVELEMWTRADDGKIIVEFYANGRKYDEVAIRPYAPAASAHIEIAPATTFRGIPLDLELLFTGHHGDIPWAVLHAGQIRLELYVREKGKWAPPPSAWSIGCATYELSYASVVPQDVGSAIVKPGPPNPLQLWAGTVVVTPFGINITTSADPSPYAESLPELVDFGNGTRLVLAGAYVNGRPAQSLSSIPLGSLVEFQYKRQYFVSISTPGNFTAGWFEEGSTIVVDVPPVVDFGNGTRLAKPTLNGAPLPATYRVTGPANLSVSYVKQYLVTYLGPTWRNQTWIDAGATMAFNPPQIIDFGNDTRLIHPLVNGTKPPLAVVVDRPLVVVVSYTRQYLVSLTSPINRTAVWANASSPVVLRLPPIVDFGNGTRLVEPRINGTRPPLVIEVDRPMSFVGAYVNKQYLVTYSGPIWLNRTWINAGATMAFNPPQIIDFGNNTRLVNPLINGTEPPLSITVDKPIGLSVEYARQYLVSINTPFNNTSVWINAGASYAPPASATSRNGVMFVPAYLTIDGRRAPLAPVAVEAPLDITVHYNAYAEVPTAFLGLPALYAEASITCGGASNSTSGFFAHSLRLELIDAPADKCSASAHGVPSLALLVVVAVVAALVVLFRKRVEKSLYHLIFSLIFSFHFHLRSDFAVSLRQRRQRRSIRPGLY